MSSFSDEWLSELRINNDIVNVVSEYVQLKQQGNRHWGCCPFHSEKTASFNVQQDKQLFYCFGCHKGGDVIDFIMDTEKLTFPESVEYLARRANMELPREPGGKASLSRKEKDRLYEVLREAAMFFYRSLNEPGGKQAMEYLKSRGLSASTIKRFGLGFAKDSWDALISHLQGLGYTPDEITGANLAVKKEGKFYDFFRNRIMFPIIDVYGKVIGFGGRVLNDSLPKYINTSDTLVFNKRRNLYGLNYIDKRQKSPKLVMVEGYMDVISLYENARAMAIATLGTALTKEQARLIKRFSTEVYIAYDGDTAGQNATLRGLDILKAEGLNVKVITFPNKQDPDDFVKERGRAGLVEALNSAFPLMEYKLRNLALSYDLSDADEKMRYTIKAAELLNELQPVEKERYIRLLQGITGYTMEALYAQTSRQSGVKGDKDGNKRNNNESRKSVQKGGSNAEKAVIVTMAKGKEAFERVLKLEPVFADETLKKLYGVIKGFQGKEFSYPDVIAALDEEMAAYAVSIFSEFEVCATDEQLTDCINSMRRDALEKEIAALAKQADIEIDKNKKEILTKKLQELTVELKA